MATIEGAQQRTLRRRVTIPAAQVLALFAAPQPIVPAPGAGKALVFDGALIQKNPLLIQKAMADKLSDKISVIIAPPPADGGFIGSALLGAGKGAAAAQHTAEPSIQEGE